MTEKEAETQDALRGVVQDLKTIRARLNELARGLPASTDNSDVEKETDTFEARSIIDCVLIDQINPAIRDLEAAADYRPDKAPTVD